MMLIQYADTALEARRSLGDSASAESAAAHESALSAAASARTLMLLVGVASAIAGAAIAHFLARVI